MKLLTAALLGVAATIHPSQGRREGDTVPEYTAEDCDNWISDANSYDADGSGGLNQSEFYAWLQGAGIVASDSQEGLAWPLQMAFLGLACECQALGYGDDCCTGDNAQFPISDITGDSITSAAAEIKGYMCDNLATTVLSTLPPTPAPVVASAAEPLSVSIVGSVLDYSSFDYSGILDGSSKPTYFDAAEINANEGDNNVITELSSAYQLLADELMGSSRRSRLLRATRTLQTLNTVTASDVGKCECCTLSNVVFLSPMFVYAHRVAHCMLCSNNHLNN